MDYNSLKLSLNKVICIIFEEYVKKYGIKNICGFALYSDEEAMSLSVSVNTYKHHKNNVKEDPENKLYYKFNPEEWNEIIENNELDKINQILQENSLKIKKKQFAEYRKNIYTLSLEVLNELKSNGLFKDMKNDFVLLFSISDCDLSEMVIEYNKKYNSNEIVNEYEQWIKEESEYNEDEDFDE